MLLRFMLILVSGVALHAAATDITGKWKADFSGSRGSGPRTAETILLDVKVDGTVVTGKVKIGSWPGDAPIAEGKVEGDHITFTATNQNYSTTGVPLCKFDVTIREGELFVTMTSLNEGGGGIIRRGANYEYRGKRALD